LPNDDAGQDETHQTRVLILAPVGRDAELACTLLQHEELIAETCSDVAALVAKLGAGAGTAVIADEALIGNIPRLQNWVKNQPAWSDFPFIILTGAKTLPGKMQERLALMQGAG
jgi:hypothetical protein